jgi:CRP/FNR family transcriptional regulator, cyclic AMP receptor protein
LRNAYGFDHKVCHGVVPRNGHASACIITVSLADEVREMLPKCDIQNFLVAVNSKRTVLKRHKRQIIFSQGEPSDAMFHIEQGTVKLTVASISGKEAIIELVGTGEFFGESSIAYTQPHRFQTAIALTDVSLVKIDGEAIKNALRIASDALYHCISSILRRNARIQQDFANNLLDSSAKRLARALLSLSKLNGDRSAFEDITQQDWADMLGLTRQRVNVLLRQFRRQGFIGDARGLEVHPSIVAVAGTE